MKKEKFPYDYKSYSLTSVNGSATFIGKPSRKLLQAVNKLAELAYKEIKTKSIKQL